MPHYHYRSLSSGNSGQFVQLDNELISRGIRAHYSKFRSGGRIWRINSDDLHLLPFDENGPYFGTKDYGYSLFDDTVDGEEWRTEFEGGPWIEIK